MTRVAPRPRSWLDRRLEVRDSPIEGRGLFATGRIAAGTVVVRLGGQLVSESELRRSLEKAAAGTGPYVASVVVDAGAHLRLSPDDPSRLGNHSCDPNLWWTSGYDLAARRDVLPDEELTNDYATSTGLEEFSMPCRCGTERCRGVVTGADWRLAELRARYGRHWVPFLLDRIEAEDGAGSAEE